MPKPSPIPPSDQASLEPSIACPVCGSDDWTIVYQVRSVPVTCASLFATASAAKSVERGEVELGVCNCCAFVFNRAFSASLAHIGSIYESTQSASPHFSAYIRSVAEEWVQGHGLAGKRVVEIGCGSGDFLTELVRDGVAKAIGVDPLVNRYPIADTTDDRLQLINATFEESYADVEADALVCRHTLEHIQDVDRFLGLVSRWAGGNSNRVILFEVPACERIFSECAFWDIYYEHCNYFTETSLSGAFIRCGLDVQKLTRTYDDQYLMIEAKAGDPHFAPFSPAEIAADRKSALDFGSQAYRTIEHARQNVRALRTDGPVAIWQGAAKTVGFVGALGEPEMFSCAIDINPNRQEMYLPGSGLRVVSPEKLTEYQPANVILMNPAYRAEVDAILQTIVPAAKLCTVNEVSCDNVAVDQGSAGAKNSRRIH